MKIEILYPKLCNLYGDSSNILYLKKTLPSAEFIETKLNEKPRFLDEKIDLVYIGSTSEKYQELIINDLMKYKDEIKNKIDKGQFILATGNSFEIFCNYIETEENKKINCLGIFNCYAKRNLNKRHNSLFLGEFNNINIVGYKSQFTHTYGLKDNYFIKVTKGIGINPEEKYEGIHKNNFYGTYILGPILVLNPYFTKYLLKKLGYKKELAFEEDSIKAYNIRLKELQNDKTIFGSMHN